MNVNSHASHEAQSASRPLRMLQWWPMSLALVLAFVAAAHGVLRAAEGTATTESAAEGDLSSIPASAVTDDDIIKFINAQIRKGWEEYNFTPSGKATDSEWCRRLYLDLIGRVPRVSEVLAFLNDRSPDKRQKLVDRLLGDEYLEDYARNWTTIWSIRLVGRPPARRDNRDMVSRPGMQKYLRDSFLRNKPYDKMVVELVSATGNTTPGEQDFNGAANFLIGKLQENATEATSRVARYFLGMQVQCTQCHNHPFNTWKQDQFWSMNAFFRQTRGEAIDRQGREITASILMNQDFAGEGSTPKEAEIYFELRNGTMAVAYPTFVDGTKINPSGYLDEVDRRAELAKLIVNSEFCGQAIVNYMWSHFFGYGFTKPIDDMGPHNPPSHPELVERLGKEFSAKGHDLKRLIRWIVLSEPYSLSSRISKGNVKDDPTLGEKPRFSHFYVRQMQAEQLYESLLVATEADKNRGSYEDQEAVKADWLRQFTLTFANDEGDDATTFNGTIPQALMMMNGEMIKAATSIEPGSFLQRLAVGGMSAPEVVDYLYLSAFGRRPSGSDLAAARALMALRGSDVASAYQDVWWALLNSNEFIFIY